MLRSCEAVVYGEDVKKVYSVVPLNTHRTRVLKAGAKHL